MLAQFIGLSAIRTDPFSDVDKVTGGVVRRHSANGFRCRTRPSPCRETCVCRRRGPRALRPLGPAGCPPGRFRASFHPGMVQRNDRHEFVPGLTLSPTWALRLATYPDVGPRSAAAHIRMCVDELMFRQFDRRMFHHCRAADPRRSVVFGCVSRTSASNACK